MKTKTLSAALVLLSLLAMNATAQVTVTSVLTNGLVEPYGVVVDPDNNVYISDSANNRIVKIDPNTQGTSTLAGLPLDAAGSNDGPSYLAHFNDPQGLILATIGGTNGLLVADHANNLIRFVNLTNGTVSTLSGRTSGGPAVNAIGSLATFLYPVGMDKDASGNVYIADWGNNTIRVMNLNDPVLGVTNLVISGTSLFRPTAVAVVGTNQLWVADTGNQMVKLITLTTPTAGSLTTVLGAFRTTGTTDSTFGPSARFNGPSGLLYSSGTLLISDTLNNTIRLVTNYPNFGPTNYAVFTYAGTPGQAGLVDGSPLSSKFNSPYAMAEDLLNNGILVADLKNNALRRIQVGPQLPPIPAPQLGWVLFVKDNFGDYVSELQIGQSFIFNNDVIIAILGTDGTETHFTTGPTPTSPLNDTIPNPSANVGSSPPIYRNGQIIVQPSIITAQPDVTIKAVGFQVGRLSSPIVSARFQFKAGNPLIQGNNAASFTVSDQTLLSEMWYTTDGSDPSSTNGASTQIPSSQGGTTVSLPLATNFTFKVRAFRDNYQPSDIASQDFSVTNFNANKISFGFATGEASSDFVAAAGQYFYAPVTLTILPSTKMYSLQFNLTVTNGGPNPGPAVTPGAYGFESFLEKPIPGQPGFYEKIPPLAFDGLLPYVDPPPGFGLVTYDGAQFINMVFTNVSNNLLGVGWFERFGETNLYLTHEQDLIKYSQPHDTLFDELNGHIVAGGYGFQVPLNAQHGQTYQILIGRPSATSDGVGTPGSDVYIATPTNGSYSAGTVNAIKNVTVGQLKYIAGDSAPFRWFNAGDFGNSNLDNSDVMQVFQSAIYTLDYPPAGSDFFDVMDSCGGLYADLGNGYLEYSKPIFGANELNPLFDGNDTTINQIAFGDGVLDVCDIYVTFRRSLDPSLTWFRRFWTNGVRAAEIVGNGPPPQALNRVPATTRPSVNFASTDLRAAAGQTLQIPISAQVFGSYPLRVMMLNMSVKPLDGSPPLTSQIQFAPNPVLGQPTLTASAGIGNYAGSWLNTSVSGLTSNAVVGTLTIQIPGNAPSNSAYAIHFDHASASPNGLASFPKQTMTGLITLSDRSSSTFLDGIPDSWRLRYFGSVNNLLSQASADADGDGATNMQEYTAGTDPTDAKSCLRVASNKGASQDAVIRWPSVVGKHYVIERCSNLFAPNWIPVSTNTGVGTDMEFHDTTGGNTRFYRVHVQ